MSLTGIVPEEIAEELAGGGQDDLVGPDGLALAHECDVGEEREVQVVGQCREDGRALLVLVRADQVLCAAAASHGAVQV